MKNLKVAFLGLILMAVTAISASAQSVRYTTYSGSAFDITNTTDPTLIAGLASLSNWGSFSVSNPSFSGTPNLAALKVTIPTGAPVPDVNGTVEQDFFNAVKDYYDLNGAFPNPGNTFQIQITVSMVQHTYTLEVQTKN